MKRNIIAGFAAAMCALPMAAHAANNSLTADAAEAIISGCKAHALAKDQSQAIAVYDVAGSPVAFLRMEGNPPGVALFAMQKAKAVATWRFPTADMKEAAISYPGFASAPNVVTIGGGVPIYAKDGKTFIGAAAASGEPPEDDVACVVAGIEAAGLKSERKKR